LVYVARKIYIFYLKKAGRREKMDTPTSIVKYGNIIKNIERIGWSIRSGHVMKPKCCSKKLTTAGELAVRYVIHKILKKRKSNQNDYACHHKT
jgi:hypothetical protein